MRVDVPEVVIASAGGGQEAERAVRSYLAGHLDRQAGTPEYRFVERDYLRRTYVYEVRFSGGGARP